MAERTTSFELYKDKRGEWRWRFKASNGNIIATSSEGYKGKQSAMRGIELCKESADSPVKEV